MTQQEFQIRYRYNPTTDCIGEGGFGKVYKAYDTHLDKFVAIKIAEVKTGLENVRLKKEVELISKLPTHPNIANYEVCYTFSSFTGEYDFAVLQYYEEGNLQQLIDSGKLNPKQKEAFLSQVLEGINFLHNQGIIHRDIKPQNILIAKRNGEYIPKITDFGISKKLDINNSSVFTNSLAGAGTMTYASPEQLLGKTIKKNTDLWSFGVIVCQVFTGKLPFSVGRDGINSEAGRIELYKQIVNGTISYSTNTIPASWQQLVKQCIVVDSNVRADNAEKCLRIFNYQNINNVLDTVIEDVKYNTKTSTEELNSPLKNAEDYYNRALKKISVNNYSSAILDLNEAIKFGISRGYHFKRGVCYQNVNKLAEAIYDYSEELKLFGNHVTVFHNRAICYERDMQKLKASYDFLSALEMKWNDSYFDKWFSLAEEINNQTQYLRFMNLCSSLDNETVFFAKAKVSYQYNNYDLCLESIYKAFNKSRNIEYLNFCYNKAKINISFLDKCINQNFLDKGHLYFIRANINIDENKTNEVIDDLKKAKEIGNTNAKDALKDIFALNTNTIYLILNSIYILFFVFSFLFRNSLYYGVTSIFEWFVGITFFLGMLFYGSHGDQHHSNNKFERITPESTKFLLFINYTFFPVMSIAVPVALLIINKADIQYLYIAIPFALILVPVLIIRRWKNTIGIMNNNELDFEETV